MNKTVSIFCIILALVLMTAYAFSANGNKAYAARNEERDYVRFTATDNDPFGTFGFSPSGKNAAINPETVQWAVIRYKTETAKDTAGHILTGQLYITPAEEPCINVDWNFTGNWENVKVDLSSWNSEHYTDNTAVRFDPMQANPASEEGAVEANSAICVAWIAFFESEEDAGAYTGTEDTPYCIVTAEELSGGTFSSMTAERITSEEPVETLDPADVPEVMGFYDINGSVTTGWWNVNPYKPDQEFIITADIPVWFDGVNMFTLCSSEPVPVSVEIRDESGDVVAEAEPQNMTGNGMRYFTLNKKVAPGLYDIAVICLDFDEYDDTIYTQRHFVLGSGSLGDLPDFEIMYNGFAVNDNTMEAPAVSFNTCEADPNYTEKPSKAPTEAPTTVPTLPPDVATDVPDMTAAPKTAEADKTKNADSGNTGIIIGIIAAACALIAAAVIFTVCKRRRK